MNKDKRTNGIRTLLEAKRIQIFGLNNTKIKKTRRFEIWDKLIASWVLHSNSELMDNYEGDLVWVG